MEKVTAFIKGNYKTAIILVVVVVVIYLLFTWWKAKDAATVKILNPDGTAFVPTAEQTNTATGIATRIYTDLNSGWFFGKNIWGVFGRDDEAYLTLAGMSTAMFALTVGKYNEKYKRSLIADLRAESSIGQQYKDIILQKAEALKLV